MKIVFKNKLQAHVADLLWNAETDQQLKSIFAIYGKDAVTVQQMIIAHSLDEVNDTELAEIVINSIK